VTRALLVALVVLGCAEDTRGREVLLWHSYASAEKDALEAVAARFNAQSPDVKLRLVGVPHDAFSDKITAAVPNGNGPDLFIFAHDRIGDWAEGKILEPIEFFVDESVADRFDRQAVNAMVYRDSLYGLPLAVKSLALFYRTDLIASPPKTTDELMTVGRALTDPAAGRFGLAYEDTKLYFHAPLLHGFGGRVFDDAGNLTIATPAAEAAARFARELRAIVPPEVTGTVVGTLFAEGKVAMAISGPWLVGSLKDHWKVAPLPVVTATGKPLAPFLGAEGVMMSAYARDKRAAFQVMDYLTGDGSALTRAATAGQVVPNHATYDDPQVKADEVLSAFRAQATVAVPMPSTPDMRMVWTPYDTALQAVLAQGADATATFTAAQRDVAKYIDEARALAKVKP
jgi:maltose-binding protein MalE